MVGAKLETNDGTDELWARPGNLAQNPKTGPSPEQQKKYEGINGSKSDYPRPSDQKSRSNEPFARPASKRGGQGR